MNNEQKLKLIPYGISNFNDFGTKNLYYVDKTIYISKIEEKGSYLFFIRPRRFGKSLLLSILEKYYDIKQKDNFDTIFIGTYIQQHPTREKNSYLILKLDFSLIEPELSMIARTFLDQIKFDAEFFLNKYKDYLNIDLGEAIKRVKSLRKASTVLSLVLNYCKIADQRIYVIIDEYDNFANTILSTAGKHEYIKITRGQGFLRAFFNVLKGGTSGGHSSISRLFMTGVSPITLDDVTSGFNIATNISLDADLNEMVGFTRDEVKAMIEYYRPTGKIPHSTPELIELMSSWYNNYRFSKHADRVVFNSVQVLYFLNEYLKYSMIPETLIDQNILIDYQKLRHFMIVDQQSQSKPNGNFSMLQEIIKNGAVHTTIKTRFPISELTKPENFVSLLYYFGLLTITGVDEENDTILAIPNETIKRLYYDYIKESNEETGTFTLDFNTYTLGMKEMAYKGNWQPIIVYLTERMAQSTGLRDFITGEKVIQAFLNVYLGLGNLYILHTEKEINKGFADLVLEPALFQYPAIKYAYLIELKYLKLSANKPDDSPLPDLTEKIKALRIEAENQLKQYALDEKFQKTIGHTTLIKLVLIFCGHRLVYKGEVKDQLKDELLIENF